MLAGLAYSATMWVDAITLMPLWATSASSSPVASAWATGSRFINGSSSNGRPGQAPSARASAAWARCPPASRPHRRISVNSLPPKRYEKQSARSQNSNRLSNRTNRLLEIPSRVIHIRQRPKRADIDIPSNHHSAKRAHRNKYRNPRSDPPPMHHHEQRRQTRHHRLNPEQRPLTNPATTSITVETAGQISMDIRVNGKTRRRHHPQRNPPGTVSHSKHTCPPS